MQTLDQGKAVAEKKLNAYFCSLKFLQFVKAGRTSPFGLLYQISGKIVASSRSSELRTILFYPRNH